MNALPPGRPKAGQPQPGAGKAREPSSPLSSGRGRGEGGLYLAGDLGGTKALFGIAEFAGDIPIFTLTRRYASADFASLEELLTQFRADAGDALNGVVGACLAVAGPVSDDGRQARFTNLPWQADAAALEKVLGSHVTLANDFAAVAAGIAVLPAEDRLCLQTGQPRSNGVRLAIGAGTGLGMACIVPTEDGFNILPSEGGHVGYAPADNLQAEFAAFLRDEQERATAERAISGMGLVSLYRFLVTREAADLPDPLASDDPAAAIGTLALSNPQSLARRTVDIFMASYGAFAGDMALALLAHGGVYLAGGVTQKLLPLLKDGAFMTAFNAKAEHAAIARQIPVHVVTAPEIGLQGAATLAQRAFLSSRPLRS
ncbi:MAG: glucokinase [Gammaproteobacteria bacterium]|nr:glucokinase [Rhodocyclaceae bacterium]MBU3909493.1 glucokinase [Gammaproteobacteria bacterium]MBU3987790.1 glucokinase [Gammaproteobacteria bacterium]MBU4003156.1 glucokinase [Gammaproteobacteria bacterium]MBU4022205.1 glucokinase [Gammaproteobacteria bacterium]